MLELANKNFKVTTVNTFKNLKENIVMTNTKKGKHTQIQRVPDSQFFIFMMVHSVEILIFSWANNM